VTLQTADYCREIEAHLCRKNDGHLIRIVGPSFDLVAAWAADGVPLTIACRGIDRYFERYYRKGTRRRPVRIDFCDADVRDLFDEWRRAVGLTAERQSADPADVQEHAETVSGHRGPSLPAHLERVVLRLTSARVAGTLGADADGVIDRIAQELDAARSSARGIRGDARRALIERLAEYDRELLTLARRSVSVADMDALENDAAEQLSAHRSAMPADAYARASQAAIDRLVRERTHLPTLVFN
jgi:hypothetical protein